jgi:hypothetical protein
MPEKIFCGSVFPHRTFADVFDVRLEADVLRPHIYTGQDRNGQPIRYVNISVKKSQQGNWYCEINQFKPQPQGAQQQQAAPQQPAAPRPAPPPFPATPPPAAQSPPPTAPAPQQPAAPGPDLADPIDDIPFSCWVEIDPRHRKISKAA